MAGKYDNNPMLNSIMYEVEFADRTVKEYGANIIAENMLRQVDLEGFSLALMEGIVDFRCDESVAIPMGEMYIITKTGQKRLRKTMARWDLLVHWKDESESWVKLSDMKESHPETAAFARAKGVQGEPAFCWWVPYTLQKMDAIVAAVGARLRKTTHKYGVEIPSYEGCPSRTGTGQKEWEHHSHTTTCVGCENGFHTESLVGVRWS